MNTAIVPQSSVSPLENQPGTPAGTSPVPQHPSLPHPDLGKIRTAVGYVRVSTSMQADDGLSLEAQRAAIAAYCSSHDLRLIRIYQDVESGAKSERSGLQGALATQADVLVVLKFDRISPSIKHFCQLYEDYFAHSMGYFFGKVPYGKRAVPAPENPRYRILDHATSLQLQTPIGVAHRQAP